MHSADTVTVEDVRQLMGASTPHFALQLRNRIAKLIADLPARAPGAARRRARDRAPGGARVHGRDARRGPRRGRAPAALARAAAERSARLTRCRAASAAGREHALAPGLAEARAQEPEQEHEHGHVDDERHDEARRARARRARASRSRAARGAAPSANVGEQRRVRPVAAQVLADAEIQRARRTQRGPRRRSRRAPIGPGSLR